MLLAEAAGVDVLTHAPIDRPLDDSAVQRTRAAGQVAVPTLTMMEAIVNRLSGIAPVSYDVARDTVGQWHRAGVTILAGTDANQAPSAPASPPYGTSLHHELGLLVDAGLSPVDALRSATVLAAGYWGLADRGVIAPGKRADLVRGANDNLAAAVRRHPDRFAAFAALPTTVPYSAAAELERCVSELGFAGTMIMGRTEGEFLSAERFDPVLRTAARLGVPIYLHPALPTRVTSADNYEAGLDPIVAARFATAAWGWHSETGVHFLHMVLSGVFDRYPDLQVILGHWGEMIPWFLYRLDEALPPRATKLERTIGEYVRQNSYYTPGGMFTEPHLRFCVDVLGTERLIYAVDYPFVGNDGAVDFLLKADLPESVKEDIGHRNAERLLPGLS